jgi:2-polyprenyl-3-methyl-5-hydroxy-6-metoxy-1,4-benzoquinol methylase
MDNSQTLAVTARKAVFRRRASCILCQSNRLKTLWTSSFQAESVRAQLERGGYSGNPLAVLQDSTFRRVQCQNCTMAFQLDILSDEWLKVLYGKWISSEQIAKVQAARGSSLFLESIQNIKHGLRLRRLLGAAANESPRLLDFGCGDGKFLKAANLLGFEAFGVDFSESRRSRSRQLGNITLYSNLEDLQEDLPVAENISEGRFDAVTLFQVLEHLANPIKTLQQLSAVLKPGGILVVEVPDCKGVGDIPTTPDEHSKVDPLEHINHFTPRTLTAMCEEVGFSPIAPGAAYVSAGLPAVIKAAIGSVVRHPIFKPWTKRTSQYFRKVS